jgi:hypothetical protein
MVLKKASLAHWGWAAALVAGLTILPADGAFAKDDHSPYKHAFSGRYFTAYHGFDASITGTSSEPNPPAVPYAVSGTLVSDGKGNLKGIENLDYGAPGTGAAATCQVAGTYSVNPVASNGVAGGVTLSLTYDCQTVTCTFNSATTPPTCTASGTSAPSAPDQWFCEISGASGKRLVCTEMGESASGTTFQTPISAVTWERSNGSGQGDD